MHLNPVSSELLVPALLLSVQGITASGTVKNPNVIIILADDLGYGDLSCYGNPKVKTPVIDRLAAEGIRFTDAHTNTGLCTPSRYSLLTGRYCWRTFLKKHVIANGPALIETNRTTLASLFKESGYSTAVFGKWHLGHTEKSEVDYNRQPVPHCANDVGFTYSFTLPVGHFYPPYIYLENGRVVNYDPADPVRLEGNRQTGGESYSYDRHEVTPELVRRMVSYMGENRKKPFFIYLALPNVHDPLTPSAAFKGNPVGPYGDYIEEMDWAVGQVLVCLEKLRLDKNTLVIFTSDNGASEPNIKEAGGQYNPNGILRGDKGDLYEGGHRMPFIVRWPGQAPQGMVSGEFIVFSDLLRTFAALLRHPVTSEEGPDGENVLDAFKGARKLYPDRPVVITSRQGMYGLRQGDWMYLHGSGNGDIPPSYSQPKEKISNAQLFNLKNDIQQTRNLAGEFPEKVETMRNLLEKITTEVH